MNEHTILRASGTDPLASVDALRTTPAAVELDRLERLGVLRRTWSGYVRGEAR